MVGLGAIGGSLAWQARQAGVARVVGYSASRAEAVEALKASAITEMADTPGRAVRGADLVVLPDEPYRFTADDGPEAVPGLPAALVSGRLLTWYGPSMVQAPQELGAALRAALE